MNIIIMHLQNNAIQKVNISVKNIRGIIRIRKKKKSSSNNNYYYYYYYKKKKIYNKNIKFVEQIQSIL